MPDVPLDGLLLARIQFAFTIAVHIVFPALSIGLSAYLAVLEGLWLSTGQDRYLNLFKYWLKPFALVFGMGVVSGIVMSYEFGTNWSRFSDLTGPILGPLMGYEVLTAFFLEAGFLGIMLFGLERVGPRMHFGATVVVAVGTAISAFWILSVNSWMQTPAGYDINAAGQFVPQDWWAIVFNPSFPYRLAHMLLAAYLTTSFVVGAVAAYHLLRGSRLPEVRTAFSMSLWMAGLVAPLQVVVGDLHGLNTLAYQPAKVAAMEGHYESHQGAPLILFGLPDSEAGQTRYALQIPKLGSLILTHDWEGEVDGLNTWPKEDWPNVPLVFHSFRVMVGLGVLMVAVGLLSFWLRWRRRLYDTPWFARMVLYMGPSGIVALLAGWTVTEVGRQPFTVYGLLRTAESVSPVDAPAVAASLLAFVVTYFVLFGAGLFYLLRLFSRPPRQDGALTTAHVRGHLVMEH